MDTREAFRGALEKLKRWAPESLSRRPAFVYSLPERPSAVPLEAEVSDLPAAPASVIGTARAILDGVLSAVEVVTRSLERVNALNGTLRAFVSVQADAALREAELLDRELKQGKVRGPLHGVPISVKDVIHVAGVPTTASSKVLDDLTPDEDAVAVARLRAAGAVILGKTETHEFALGVTCPQSRNPWDPTRIPGGSSGGSAIAVVRGMTPGSLGTDTRASIRVPAALSGVVGFKPTFGLVPTHGVVTLSWSMDHVAPMAGNIADAVLLLDVIAGRDPRDPNSVVRPVPSYQAFLRKSVSEFRLAVPRAALEGCDAEVERAFRNAMAGLTALGVSIVEVAEPDSDDLEMTNAAGLIVSRCEAAAYHRHWLAERAQRYTPETFAQLDEASRVPAVSYVEAQRFRSQFTDKMRRLLSQVDALILPTTPVTAPKVEEAEQYLLILSRNCIPWSFIGFPAVSVPCGRSRAGLPIGLQLVAPPFEDGRLITLASAVESLGAWKPDSASPPM